MGSDGRALHAVFSDNRQGRPDVFLRTSTDGGQTWGLAVLLDRKVGYTYEVGDRCGPDVASAPGAAFVVWSDSSLGTGLTDTQDTALRRAEIPPVPSGA